MMLKTTLPLLLAALALSEGCASTAPQTVVTNTTPRRRRRRAAQPAAPVAQPQRPATQREATGAESAAPTGLTLVPAAPRASDRRPDGGAMEARTSPRSSFGTPVVRGGGDVGELHAQQAALDGQARVRCEGTAPSTVPSTQSPYEPSNASIVRSFLPVERRVVACHPPADSRGRLPAHGLFSSNGAPTEFTFPGVSLTREQAACVGEALCAVRVPSFRAPSATVDYEVLVYVTEP